MNNSYDLDNDLDLIGCSQPVLSINDQVNNIYIISGTVVTFKICGYPNADFIVQDVGAGGIEGRDVNVNVNLFYPYDVIDRGKLDSDGIHVSSMPLNNVGTYFFRVGIWCTIADIDYCTKVSNAVMVVVLEKDCTPNYVCKQPLDGYEYDANYCGQPERVASRCNPECGGVGCEEESNLLKTGIIVAIVGTSIYLLGKEIEKKGRK